MLDKMTDAIDFHGKALTLRAQRQELLSSNIANADTPGFKARDFDFASALKTATAGSASAVGTAAALSAPASTPNPANLSTLDRGGLLQSSAALSRSRPGHMQVGHTDATLGGSAVEHSSRLEYIRPEQAAMDSNTVDLNRERASFADNSLRYEATLRFINGRVRSMITAIRGE